MGVKPYILTGIAFGLAFDVIVFIFFRTRVDWFAYIIDFFSIGSGAMTISQMIVEGMEVPRTTREIIRFLDYSMWGEF